MKWLRERGYNAWHLVWAFCEPPAAPEHQCIYKRCWRPSHYDGLCVYHINREYR